MNAKLLCALLPLVLCGCFKTRDELTLNPDGSGSVHLETRILVPAETLNALGMGARMTGGEELPAVYPPTSEAEAKRWFPARDFTLTTKQETTGDSSTLVIDAAFKDVNVLLASPYAKAHSLTLKIENGALRFQAVTGIEAAARLAETKDTGLFGNEFPGLDQVKKVKDEMRAEFRVTLPTPVTSAGAGGAKDGRSVTWVADRTKQTNAAGFAQQAGALLEAACAADGLQFKPVTPARLATLAFKDAPSGALGEKAAGPDPKKISAAAKFVPYSLRVTRTIDLSGEGGSGQNQAQLVGAVVLPRDLAPQKWGEVRIEEILDTKGASLRLAAEDNPFGGHFLSEPIETAEEDEEGQSKEESNTAEHRHVVTLAFKPPDWKMKEIASIKAAITLQYFAGTQVVKVTNAIAANWIREMKSESDFEIEPTPKAINDPSLPGLDLSLNLAMGITQGSFTSLSLQVESTRLAVTDGQVYDADGRPWPTFFNRQAFGEENGVTLMVAGTPRPPLSLALVTSGIGASVEVPILLEKVPVGAK